MRRRCICSKLSSHVVVPLIAIPTKSIKRNATQCLNRQSLVPPQCIGQQFNKHSAAHDLDLECTYIHFVRLVALALDGSFQKSVTDVLMGVKRGGRCNTIGSHAASQAIVVDECRGFYVFVFSAFYFVQCFGLLCACTNGRMLKHSNARLLKCSNAQMVKSKLLQKHWHSPFRSVLWSWCHHHHLRCCAVV